MNENSYANDPFRFMINMSHRPYQMIICIYLLLTFQCLIEKLTFHISSNNLNFVILKLRSQRSTILIDY